MSSNSTYMRGGAGDRRGFTLIELLVAISVSVILLSILTFVFKLSTDATRAATQRIEITEKLRSINIRMRQEIGAMVPVFRNNNLTYEIEGPTLTFATVTTVNYKPDKTSDYISRQLKMDVRYEFIKLGTDKSEWKLVRRRDYDVRNPPLPGPNGEDLSVGNDKWENLVNADTMLDNVRDVTFEVVDKPLAKDDPTAKDLLNPRYLPGAIKMKITFAPEGGEADTYSIVFPVQQGIENAQQTAATD